MDNGMTRHMDNVFDMVYGNIENHQKGKQVESCRVDYVWITISHNSDRQLVIELSNKTERMRFMRAIEISDLFKKFTDLIGIKIMSYKVTHDGVLFVRDVR